MGLEGFKVLLQASYHLMWRSDLLWIGFAYDIDRLDPYNFLAQSNMNPGDRRDELPIGSRQGLVDRIKEASKPKRHLPYSSKEGLDHHHQKQLVENFAARLGHRFCIPGDKGRQVGFRSHISSSPRVACILYVPPQILQKKVLVKRQIKRSSNGSLSSNSPCQGRISNNNLPRSRM